MTTTSNDFMSDLEDQTGRVFQRILDGDEEQHRLAAVDDAVVVREREVVHRPHHDLAVLDYGSVLRGVHAQDGRLRRVDDRRREHRAEYAAVGNGERAPGELLDTELAVLGALAEIADLFLDLGEAHAVRIPQDGYHQAARAADRHADV